MFRLKPIVLQGYLEKSQSDFHVFLCQGLSVNIWKWFPEGEKKSPNRELINTGKLDLLWLVVLCIYSFILRCSAGATPKPCWWLYRSDKSFLWGTRMNFILSSSPNAPKAHQLSNQMPGPLTPCCGKARGWLWLGDSTIMRTRCRAMGATGPWNVQGDFIPQWSLLGTAPPNISRGGSVFCDICLPICILKTDLQIIII